MSDIAHTFGDDLAFGSNGDLQAVDGLPYSQQRILRRLLTNPGSYIWEPTYGAGLPQRIGTTYTIPEITSLIKGQMYQEASVQRSPEPDISVTPVSGGISVQIIYTETDTGQTSVLNFSVNP